MEYPQARGAAEAQHQGEPVHLPTEYPWKGSWFLRLVLAIPFFCLLSLIIVCIYLDEEADVFYL